jgi:hypothetical protein
MRFSAGIAALITFSLNGVGLPEASLAQTVTHQTQPVVFAPLDGLEFDAGIVRQEDGKDPAEPLTDRLLFANGKFSSRICERYGFVPGAYWVRGTADEIEFSAVLHSPTDGTMEWQGTVKDGKLDGTMRWIRERWYWTIEADHRISGQLSSQPSGPTSSD